MKTSLQKQRRGIEWTQASGTAESASQNQLHTSLTGRLTHMTSSMKPILLEVLQGPVSISGHYDVHFLPFLEKWDFGK
jgi:hypothetical protein